MGYLLKTAIGVERSSMSMYTIVVLYQYHRRVVPGIATPRAFESSDVVASASEGCFASGVFDSMRSHLTCMHAPYWLASRFMCKRDCS